MYTYTHTHAFAFDVRCMCMYRSLHISLSRPLSTRVRVVCARHAGQRRFEPAVGARASKHS